jgi:GNAT superfamily N-acetyltransferase
VKSLPNPHDAMQSLEDAIACGDVRLQKGEVDPTLWMTVDKPNGELRLTYVRLEVSKVVALVMAIECEPFESKLCLNIGYAVAETHRGKGVAKEIVKAAIAEMQKGFGRTRNAEFYVEAIVGEDNLPSMRVAEQVISSTYNSMPDSFSGIPIRQYLLRIAPV